VLPSADILLATLNAKFIHCAFGLRCLLANMGELQPRTALLEFEIQQRPLDIVEAILARRPRIVGLGVYIWNVRETTEVVAALKRIAPEVIVILCGPEVSFEWDGQEIVRLADHVITGEADVKFAEVCRARLASPPAPNPDLNPDLHSRSTGAGGAGLGLRLGAGEDGRSLPKIIPAELPKLEDIALPYDLYTDADLAHRVIYVEASRGCPFTCEFCLSSLDIPVRQFPLEPFLGAMERLLARGATQFKFVDRTFNLNLLVSRAILQFFLARMRPGLFVHFEMVPDRLPEALREVIAQFPAGSLQFEVGVQTFDEPTSRNISRRQDNAKLADNLTWLRSRTGVHVHADLIVGLPGESLASFAAGFDRLVALGPQEIQVGILKRLRGTPIVRHDAEFAMRYNPLPPYELLSNRDLDFPTMQRLRRFARYWDLVANSGNFRTSTPLLWSGPQTGFLESGVQPTLPVGESFLPHPGPLPLGEGATPSAPEHPHDVGTRGTWSSLLPLPAGEGRGEGERNLIPAGSLTDSQRGNSPFARFLAFSDWLYARLGKRHGIALDTLAEAVFDHLTRVLGHAPELVARALLADFAAAGRRERPPFLQPFAVAQSSAARSTPVPTAPKRQSRHLEAAG
jgi:radical SAM superfamily enzyme YgiQ (UPF0313 family)